MNIQHLIDNQVQYTSSCASNSINIYIYIYTQCKHEIREIYLILFRLVLLISTLNRCWYMNNLNMKKKKKIMYNMRKVNKEDKIFFSFPYLFIFIITHRV